MFIFLNKVSPFSEKPPQFVNGEEEWKETTSYLYDLRMIIQYSVYLGNSLSYKNSLSNMSFINIFLLHEVEVINEAESCLIIV